MSKKTVCMVGLGYIGLPTAAVMASRGYQVLGYDVNAQTCATINRGEIHIVEPGLGDMVKSVVEEGALVASTEIERSDVFVVAVPTPFMEGNKPDLTYVHKACMSIAKVLEPGNLVILESTSPVGTTDKMAKWLSDARSDLLFPGQEGVDDTEVEVHLAYCPERVLPGKVIEELVANDRVIGGMTAICAEKAARFYKAFVEGVCVVTGARTAELAKLTENSFRDVNIAFANELSMICDELDINVWELISLTNRHPRVNVLTPGCGVGGHCIAVDPWFIVDSAPGISDLIRTAREVNDRKPYFVAEKAYQKAIEFIQANPDIPLKDVVITCFGLAFKPNIDDLRESAAIDVVKLIKERLPSCKIQVVEPNISSLPSKGELANLDVQLVSFEDGLNGDVKVVSVAHKEFLESDARLKSKYTVNVAWDNT